LSSLDSSNSSEDEILEQTNQNNLSIGKKRGRKNFITPKLVAALDRCKLRIRESVFVIQATAEALGHDLNNLVINKTSIHRCHDNSRTERGNMIKKKFECYPPNYVVVHSSLG